MANKFIFALFRKIMVDILCKKKNHVDTFDVSSIMSNFFLKILNKVGMGDESIP